MRRNWDPLGVACKSPFVEPTQLGAQSGFLSYPLFGNFASLPLLRWCMQSQLHLVFTHMVSHAIAPSHHRERKI